jgi:hypothetical protein
VHFPAWNVATQFYPGDQAHAWYAVDRQLGFCQACRGVVIGYGDGLQSAGRSELHQFSGSQTPIRGGGVKMEVNGNRHHFSVVIFGGLGLIDGAVDAYDVGGAAGSIVDIDQHRVQDTWAGSRFESLG